MLYQALKDWDYDGFVIADDTGQGVRQSCECGSSHLQECEKSKLCIKLPIHLLMPLLNGSMLVE